ncbi:Zn-dependent hydrolase-like glyoxylase [Thermincola ferriacetica]|uniref:Zn-dependent hydrolase-like glyoxylase n=1 Tax=Thermincola ferriacetica TaxID=281456 RepID=A0A0L6W3E0_9FIRM|nr:MBL fold metallo-hydrolase [Thermincola ferriacetica]KNZ69903.1 Zn-dependent hydrolase-like glyoxylase [Thermincola ferriacetica]
MVLLGQKYTSFKSVNCLLAVVISVTFLVTGCVERPKDGKSPEITVYPIPGDNNAANSYIVSSGGKAAVIDAGKPAEIMSKLEKEKLLPIHVILTHGHFDHIIGLTALKEKYPSLEVFIHAADQYKPADPVKNLSALFGSRVKTGVQTVPLSGRSALKIGRVTLEIIETPGHSPGSICIKAGNLLFSGDTLFKGAVVGRTDFPDSSPEALTASLKKLLALPDNTVVYPGHGPSTTLGTEKENIISILDK